VVRPLRGDEILACVHRVALSRGGPVEVIAAPPTAEVERRRRDAQEHRRATLAALRALHPGSPTPTSVAETTDLVAEGSELVISPRLDLDRAGSRFAIAHALVRVGRRERTFTYAPVIVKNSEVIETAPTRRTLEASLARIGPGDAQYTEGVGVRSTLTVVRGGVLLAHAWRVLEALGVAEEAARGALIDRNRRVWWMDLRGPDYPRFNLAAYDVHYRQRLAVLSAHEQWRRSGGEFPTAPYWHRECPECPYAASCEEYLERRDDVSLTRFTTLDQQLLLHEHGVATRAALARLDPQRARRARHRVVSPVADMAAEDHLGRAIDKLDDLIYRARVHERASVLRIVESDQMGCPTAQVEVDVDMESYDDRTYLWGTHVTLNADLAGVAPGYRAFVNWERLDGAGEARLFAQFWAWFDDVRRRAAAAGLTFRAYCFWAQAEDGAMNRAVEALDPGPPTRSELDAFRDPRAGAWIDLHEAAKRQVQTEGPLGLKVLAQATGFAWRDANPSGEASMLWYEVAVGDTAESASSRARILAYNEDDCRATKALRDWLNGPAAALRHRDDPL
jgi:predicted RecB family nuclease